MAKKEYDLWLERFSREAQIKSAIILSGIFFKVSSMRITLSVNLSTLPSMVSTVFSNFLNSSRVTKLLMVQYSNAVTYDHL